MTAYQSDLPGLLVEITHLKNQTKQKNKKDQISEVVQL